MEAAVKYLKQKLHNTSLLLSGQSSPRRFDPVFDKPVQPLTMWEILVPATENGKTISVAHHRIWDEHVRTISKGMTLLKTAKGTWVHPETQALVIEPMIPVRIICTREEILKIASYTKGYYNQHTVLAYQVSTDVIMLTNNKE